MVVNAFHLLAKGTSLEMLDGIPGDRIFLVQLADYLGDLRDITETADHRRAFPNESAHREVIADMVRKVHRAGYRGDYVFEVFNDEYLHLAPEAVAARARKAAQWVLQTTEDSGQKTD
jgi:sugar phosphate isomerase/epimerase